MIKRVVAIIMTAMFAFFLVEVEVEANDTPSPGIGEIRQFLYGKAPDGWFYCNGQYIDKQSYNELYTKIGDTFGAQEVNTFAIPDLRQQEKLDGVGYYISPTGMAAELQLLPTEAYIGEIRIYPYTIEVPNVLKAEGQLIPIRNNTALFSLMVTNFGGNGISDFKLPDFNEVFKNQANVYGYLVTSGIYPYIDEKVPSNYNSKQYTGEISFVSSSRTYTGINVTNRPSQLLNKSDYPILYGIIGTSFGGSDTDGTFMLPSPIDQLKGLEIFHIQGNGVTPTITPKALPTATEDILSFSATEATGTKTFNILANDSADARDPKIIYSLMFNNSSISLNADGTMTYKWNDVYATQHEFYYRAYNNYGGTQLTKVTVLRPQANAINFMDQNAPYSTVQALYNGELVTKPADPARTGYTFSGWYTDETYTTAYDFATPVTAPFTLYAKWAKEVKQVSFDSNGGSAVAVQDVPFEEQATSVTPTRTGYTFAGWYTDATYTTVYDFATPVTASFTLYAKWEKEANQVSFDSNGGSAVAVQDVPFEEQATSVTPTRTGYTFAGWYTDATHTTAYDFAIPVTASFTLYAKWTKNPTYSVTYDGNGTTGGQVPIDSTEYEENDPVTVQGKGTLEKSGYTFTGWNTAADGSGTDYVEGVPLTMGPANITLYAQWKQDVIPTPTPNPTYSVTYDGNGATSGQAPTDSIAYEENNQVTVQGKGTLEKPGYTFTGWNTATNGSGTDYVEGVPLTMGPANVTLYAQWKQDVIPTPTPNPTYSVTYDGNGATSGQVPTDSTAYEEAQQATVQSKGNLEKTGYTFTGWNTAADGTGMVYAEGVILTIDQKNIILYAQWTPTPTPVEPAPSPTPTPTPVEPAPSPTPTPTPVEPAPSPTPTPTPVEPAPSPTPTPTPVEPTASPAPTPAPVEPAPNPVQPVNNFEDTQAHWAQAMIEEIAAKGIITGYEDGTFRPNESVLRKHIAVMLQRALDLQAIRQANGFSDVPKHHTYYDAIMALANAGIIDGSNGNYNPDAPMTRAQLAKVLVLAFGLTPGGDSTFKDVSENHWSYPYIAALADAGIALGDEGNFNPNEPVTRAQFVAMLHRALNL